MNFSAPYSPNELLSAGERRVPRLSNQSSDSVDVYIREKPPLDRKTVRNQIWAGVLGGTAGGIGGIYLGSAIDSALLDKNAFVFAPLSWFILGSIGCAAGVYSAGDTETVTGSFGATLTGASLGVPVMLGIGMVSAFASYATGSPIGLIGLPFIIIASPACATLGFNMTRRYKSPSALGSAVINFNGGEMRLAVPRISFYRDSFGERTFSRRVNLVKVAF